MYIYKKSPQVSLEMFNDAVTLTEIEMIGWCMLTNTLIDVSTKKLQNQKMIVSATFEFSNVKIDMNLQVRACQFMECSKNPW